MMTRSWIKMNMLLVIALTGGAAHARDVVIDNASYRSYTPCSFNGAQCNNFFSTKSEENSWTEISNNSPAGINFEINYGSGQQSRIFAYDNGMFSVGEPLTSMPANITSLSSLGNNVFSPLYDSSRSTSSVSSGYQYSYGVLDNLNGQLTGKQFLRIRYDVTYPDAATKKNVVTKVEVNIVQDGGAGDFLMWYGYGGYSGVTPVLPGDALIGYSLGAYGVDTTVSANQAAIEAKSDYGLFTYRFTNAAASPVVPEPATWAMMLLGFGGVGVALRRKRRTRASVRFA